MSYIDNLVQSLELSHDKVECASGEFGINLKFYFKEKYSSMVLFPPYIRNIDNSILVESAVLSDELFNSVLKIHNGIIAFNQMLGQIAQYASDNNRKNIIKYVENESFGSLIKDIMLSFKPFSDELKNYSAFCSLYKSLERYLHP